jgi:hypothetical protein
LAIVFVPLVYIQFFQPKASFSMKAVIIDQLGEEFPNSAFVGNVTTILENHGFNVSYYNKTLDVSFFKGLAKSDYGIIILRVHSALRSDNSTVDLFTNEPYVYEMYPSEVNNGRLTNGTLLYAPDKHYFAFSSEFVENLEGNFPRSIVIAMGCWSLKTEREQMAEAFINKGAEAYVGWTDVILDTDTDYETLQVLRKLFEEDKTLDQAVSGRMRTYQGIYGLTIKEVTSRMNYYPDSASNLKISNLISQSAHSSFGQSKNLSCLITDVAKRLDDF